MWFSTHDKNPVDTTVGDDPYNHPFQNESSYYQDVATDYKIQQGGFYSNTRHYFFGGDGADVHAGSAVEDHLYGGLGADTLNGNQGNDHMEGGQGVDTYLIHPGDGFDTVFDSDGLGVIQFGSTEAKGSVGLAPADWKPLGANHWLDTQHGITYTRASDGTDGEVLTIAMGGGGVTVRGWHEGELGIELGAGAPAAPGVLLTGGDDVLPAATGALDGLAGNDLVFSSGGDATLDGGGDHDWLSGNAGDDTLSGDAGNDYLAGGPGLDVLEGGAGNDLLLVYPVNAFEEAVPSVGGVAVNEDDWRRFSRDWSWGVTFTPTPDWVADPAGLYFNVSFTFSGPETPAGERGVLYRDYGLAESDTQGDVLDGGADDDVLLGYLGEDFLFGGTGNDRLAGAEGNDALFGDEGDDWAAGGPGDDTLVGGPEATPETDADRLYGEEGDDVLLGGAGNDHLEGDYPTLSYANQGNDTLDGGAGNDELLGQGGDDTIDGGAGDDVAIGGGGHDILEGGAGADELQGDEVGLAPEQHGNDVLFGGEGNDTLFGQGGADELYGEEGDDYLQGDAPGLDDASHGADYLDGGAGNDTLIGGGGDDTLTGGAGTDTMEGGAGDDTYILDGESDDTIDDPEGANTLFLPASTTRENVTLSDGSHEVRTPAAAFQQRPRNHAEQRLVWGKLHDPLWRRSRDHGPGMGRHCSFHAA